VAQWQCGSVSAAVAVAVVRPCPWLVPGGGESGAEVHYVSLILERAWVSCWAGRWATATATVLLTAYYYDDDDDDVFTPTPERHLPTSGLTGQHGPAPS